jgi:hypothetical protein
VLLAAAFLTILLVPAGDLPLFSGIPLTNVPQLAALLLILPLLASRRVRAALVTALPRLTRGRALVVALLLLLALTGKIALLVTGAEDGWDACYHAIGVPQLASGCERSFDNALFLKHSTRFDPHLNFGAATDNGPAPGLSLSDWNLGFFNSLRWNDLQPPDYREHLPFKVTWLASADASGTITVTYVGQATLEIRGHVARLPASYAAPRSVALSRFPSRGVATIRFVFRPPPGLAFTGPYAMFRIQNLAAAGPGIAERALAWLVNLPMLALLAVIAFGYTKIATRAEWMMVAAVLLVASLPVLGVFHEAQTPTVIAVGVALGAVVLRPTWTMLLFAAWMVF